MDIIQLLPDSVANQIAAGEVIQRPSSVVKELVENAVDAGATNIEIALVGAGRTSIQVIDNGKGMSATDARLAFERHATSKIRSADDLFSLHTMGFRGEALPSIASVASVELKTSNSDDELGTCIEIAASNVISQTPIQTHRGSIFTVKNLFYNVPARRKFLKSDESEMRHIITEFQRVALANPSIAFSLYSNDDLLYDLISSSFKQRVVAIFGRKSRNFAQQLLQVEVKTDLAEITGFICKPESASKSANQYFFVNGRYMRHPYFHRAVMQAYDRLLQNDTNPSYFINLIVDPATIDINIHPTKTEIKFENEREIWTFLMVAVKESLGKFNIVPSIDFDTEGLIDIPVAAKGEFIPPPTLSFDTLYSPFKPSSSIPKTQSIPADWQKLYEESETIEIVSQHPKFELDDDFTVLDAIQIGGRYIVATTQNGNVLFDIVNAKYRIKYEQVIKYLATQQRVSQQIMFPEVLELSIDEILMFDSIIHKLADLGFDFKQIHKQSYEINSVPALLPTDCSAVLIIENLLADMTEKEVSLVDEINNIIAASLSKSIVSTLSRNTVAMSKEEIVLLVEQLLNSSDPNRTPDGKIIMVEFSPEKLLR